MDSVAENLSSMHEALGFIPNTKQEYLRSFNPQNSTANVIFAKRRWWWMQVSEWLLLGGLWMVHWVLLQVLKFLPPKKSGIRGTRHHLGTNVCMGKIEPLNPEVKGTNGTLLACTHPVCITGGFCPVQGMVH
jgi:hypothetical protein